jgi:hypothetical protein
LLHLLNISGVLRGLCSVGRNHTSRRLCCGIESRMREKPSDGLRIELIVLLVLLLGQLLLSLSHGFLPTLLLLSYSCLAMQ